MAIPRAARETLGPITWGPCGFWHAKEKEGGALQEETAHKRITPKKEVGNPVLTCSKSWQAISEQPEGSAYPLSFHRSGLGGHGSSFSCRLATGSLRKSLLLCSPTTALLSRTMCCLPKAESSFHPVYSVVEQEGCERSHDAA